jgi:single-strand DNA-binding protein
MASRSVNKVILLGHLGKDAETKFTPSGVARSTFTIATNRRWKDQQSGEWKEETDWHNVVLWRSENLANYLLKGKQVYIEGRLQSRSYDDKEGQKKYITEVVWSCWAAVAIPAAGPAATMRSRSQSPCRAPRSSSVRHSPRQRLPRPTTSARVLRTTTFPSRLG